MKRLLSLILILGLMLTLAIPCLADEGDAPLLISPAPTPITDVSSDAWYAESALWALQEGFLIAEDGAFRPSAATTRAELLYAMYQYAISVEADVSAGTETNILSYNDAFDIPEGCFEAFQWACSANLVGGENADLLPNKELTREELVVSLYAFAQWLDIDVSVGQDTNILSFNDAFDVTEGCFEAFQWACGAGIIYGTHAGNLNPHSTATRAHASVILMRFAADD